MIPRSIFSIFVVHIYPFFSSLPLFCSSNDIGPGAYFLTYLRRLLLKNIKILGSQPRARVCCACCLGEDLLRGRREEQEGSQTPRQQGAAGLPPSGQILFRKVSARRRTDRLTRRNIDRWKCFPALSESGEGGWKPVWIPVLKEPMSERQAPWAIRPTDFQTKYNISSFPRYPASCRLNIHRTSTRQFLPCETILLRPSHIYLIILTGGNCSLPLWRVHEIKRMYLAPRTHGLFIT